MARPLRIEYPGAYYHVMNRGLVYSDIFLDDNDRQRFLLLIGKEVKSALGVYEISTILKGIIRSRAGARYEGQSE